MKPGKVAFSGKLVSTLISSLTIYEMRIVEFSRKSKHLKGQLDPPVGNGNVFAPKEVSWISLLVRSHFLHQRKSVGYPCW